VCSGVSWLGPRERILHSNSFIGSHPSSPHPITSFTYECSYWEQKIQDCNLDNYSSLADRNNSVNAANAGRSVNGSHSEHLKNVATNDATATIPQDLDLRIALGRQMLSG